MGSGSSNRRSGQAQREKPAAISGRCQKLCVEQVRDKRNGLTLVRSALSADEPQAREVNTGGAGAGTFISAHASASPAHTRGPPPKGMEPLALDVAMADFPGMSQRSGWNCSAVGRKSSMVYVQYPIARRTCKRRRTGQLLARATAFSSTQSSQNQQQNGPRSIYSLPRRAFKPSSETVTQPCKHSTQSDVCTLAPAGISFPPSSKSHSARRNRKPAFAVVLSTF